MARDRVRVVVRDKITISRNRMVSVRHLLSELL